MPKRSKPIVTGAAPLQGMPVRKRKKLVKQQKERLEQGLDDDSEDAQEEPPMALDDADEVEEDMEPEELAVVHDPDPSARAADGRTIALSPDKSDKAARFFGWLMAPLSPEEFVRDFYGQRPLLVSRGGCSYLDGWFSKKELDRQLRKCALRWTDDIDAALYTNGARKTLNGEGEATPAEAWTLYKDKGCSLRLSWPQKHSDTVWRMVSLLEEHFGCGGGANVYATPPGKQGFAPHWDDIDAFILQLEGAKRWRVYAPRSAARQLHCSSAWRLFVPPGQSTCTLPFLSSDRVRSMRPTEPSGGGVTPRVLRTMTR